MSALCSPQLLKMKDTTHTSSLGSMTSRQSSNMSLDNSNNGSITGVSLEYDDYPLDLISPLVVNPCADTEESFGNTTAMEDFHTDMAAIFKNAWKPASPPPMRDKQVDRIVNEDMITDYGRRSWCNYPENSDIEGDVFINYRASLTMSQSQSTANYTDRDTVILKETSDETHLFTYENQHCCDCQTNCKEGCLKLWKPCLIKYNPLPDKPSKVDRLKYFFLCPPHGKLARILSLCFVVITGWAILWAITGRLSLPGGAIFAIIVMWSLSYVVGALFQCLYLPSFIGMLVVGILLQNIPHFCIAKDINVQWIAVIRSISLGIYILHQGLSLDLKALKFVSPVIRLVILPCFLETVAVALLGHFILNLPWVWSFFLGLLVSSVGGSVISPHTLYFRRQGFGSEDSGLLDLLTTTVTLQDKLTMTGVSLFVAIIFTKGSLVLTIFRGPVEVLGGLLYGIMCGLVCWFIPDKKHSYRTLLRFLLLTGVGIFSIIGSQALHVVGAGVLGCLVTPIVANIKWRQQCTYFNDTKKSLESALETLWFVMQPLLLSLTGTELHYENITARYVGLAIGTLLLGCLVHCVASYCCVLGLGLTIKEKLFLPLAFFPRGVLLAILCTLPVDTSYFQNSGQEFVMFGQQIAVVSILLALLTAPMGSVLLKCLGTHLLTKSKLRIEEECRVKIDLEDSSDSPQRILELPTEYETVA